MMITLRTKRRMIWLDHITIAGHMLCVWGGGKETQNKSDIPPPQLQLNLHKVTHVLAWDVYHLQIYLLIKRHKLWLHKYSSQFLHLV